MTTSSKNIPMSGDEYLAALKKLGLSQRRAALHLLGVDERSARHWTAGTRPVSPLAARFLRYLIATGKTGDYAIKKLEG
jgi:DNA-binding transcriptional regulator YiaG